MVKRISCLDAIADNTTATFNSDQSTAVRFAIELFKSRIELIVDEQIEQRLSTARAAVQHANG